MSCISKGAASACPFAFTDRSETVQNYGCLPTPHDIVVMRTVHGKTWACHEDPTKPCAGAVAHLKREGLPHTVTDTVLVTERSDWAAYTKGSL